MKRILLHDTSKKALTELDPVRAGEVKIYSCGPTVYSRQHVGNLRTYVFTDLLRRVLEHFGYRVRHVINVTDVGHLSDDADAGEDKIERAARESQQRALDVADHYFELFLRDLERLNIRAPTLWCRATQHIAEQIALAEALEARGFGYLLPDGLYFDTAKDPSYGALAGLDATREHSRIAASGHKRSAADFALWKLSPEGGPKRQLEWPSPWGVGFPGWHLECSAMATQYLGPQIDIHTGGIDHVPVHHVNEIAQSENAWGVRPWVRHWLHAGWLMLDGAKISKSAGGAPLLDDLVERGIEPEAFRYYLLTAHYRAPLSLQLEALKAARVAWSRLARFVSEAGAGDVPSTPHPRAIELESAFDAALADDLDAPRALGVLFSLHRERDIPRAERARLLLRLGGVLGLGFEPASELQQPRTDDAEIDERVAERQRARAAGDFGRADAIRRELAQRGVVVEDSPLGPKWRRG